METRHCFFREQSAINWLNQHFILRASNTSVQSRQPSTPIILKDATGHPVKDF